MNAPELERLYGWDSETLLDLALDFIISEGLMDSFLGDLNEVKANEDSY